MLYLKLALVAIVKSLLAFFLCYTRSCVQLLETASCRNAGKSCVHKTQSG
jgi:hypothetical protein